LVSVSWKPHCQMPIRIAKISGDADRGHIHHLLGNSQEKRSQENSSLNGEAGRGDLNGYAVLCGEVAARLARKRIVVRAQQMPDEFQSDQGKCYGSAGRRRTAARISSGRFLAPSLRLRLRQVLTTVL
jgi:hypothetical protein